MNHPSSGCLSFLSELIDISEGLLKSHRTRRPTTPTPEPVQDFNDVSMDAGPHSAPTPLEGHTDGTSVPLSYTVEEFSGAAKVYGMGRTFMDYFDADKHADKRAENLYYQFASRKEWEVASFLLRSSLSMAAIDSFLSLSLVCYIL
jgi:hypothetical protein